MFFTFSSVLGQIWPINYASFDKAIIDKEDADLTISSWTAKTLKGTVVNRTCHSRNEESLEITTTVLKEVNIDLNEWISIIRGQRPNLKNMSRRLNLRRGSNMVGTS